MSWWFGALEFDRRVSPSDPREVTSREGGQPEADPLVAGMTPQDVEFIWRAVEALYDTGLHPAIALCVRRGGHVLIDRTIGHARGNMPPYEDVPDADYDGPPELAHPTTLFNIFSASKAVTAILIHMLDERGVLSVDDPLIKWIPEFGGGDKDFVTLRHILSHRAGIPRLPKEDMRLELLGQWDEIVRLLCDASPQHAVGRSLAYHALTGGWLLAETLQRATGRSIREFLRTELAEPLGLPWLNYGVSPQDIPRVALHALTGPPIMFPISNWLERVLGLPFAEAIRFSNNPRFLTSVVPAGNIFATANEVSLFFELLLRGGELNGRRILSESTVRRATTEQTWREVDLTFGVPLRYSMGFILGDPWMSIYGPNTKGVYGHLGFTSVTAFADPARDISVCLMTTGKHFLTPRLWRHLGVLRAINTRCPRIV